MTKFEKSRFDMGSGSERYVMYNGKFVARCEINIMWSEIKTTGIDNIITHGALL